MSEALKRIDRLRGIATRDDALGAIWDLRDLAYDKPQYWHGFTAELLFQGLAEAVEAAEFDEVDWERLTSLLAGALTKAVMWSRPQDL